MNKQPALKSHFQLSQTLRPFLNNPRDMMLGKHSIRLLAIFFLSGTSALIYQVCWQRLLFGAFGVDIESVTVIVSTFMLGLGCGALLGGKAADLFKDQLIVLFAFCELGIGLFGIASPVVIPAVGGLFISYDLFLITVVNFILILIPASFMGATLPMLVAYSVRHDNSVGESVGTLYFFNTLGASVGAFSAGIVLFNFVTITQAIYLAASGNLIVALVAYLSSRKGNEE